MFINLPTLERLPVETEAGTRIGHVRDLEIDIDTHSIRHYIVERGLLGKEHFWVAPIHIKSITTEKIIVADTILTDPSFKTAPADVTANPALGGVTPLVEEK